MTRTERASRKIIEENVSRVHTCTCDHPSWTAAIISDLSSRTNVERTSLQNSQHNTHIRTHIHSHTYIHSVLYIYTHAVHSIYFIKYCKEWRSFRSTGPSFSQWNIVGFRAKSFFLQKLHRAAPSALQFCRLNILIVKLKVC